MKNRRIEDIQRQRYTKVFPKEIAEYIKANYKGISYRQQIENISKKFGREYTVQQIIGFYKNNGLKTGTSKKGAFPKEIVEYIKANHKGVRSIEMKEKINKKFGREYTADQIRDLYYYHHLKSGIRNAEIGREVIYKNGVHMIKTGENRWERAHRVAWERENGNIPEGMRVIFKDGNKDNIDIENLLLVSKAESTIMNCQKLHSEIPEHTEIGLNIVRLKLRIKEKRKGKGKG